VVVLPMWASFPHGQCPDRALKDFSVVRKKKKKKNPWMSLKKNKSLPCVFIVVLVVVSVVCRFISWRWLLWSFLVNL
jgi:hypothetical protein